MSPSPAKAREEINAHTSPDEVDTPLIKKKSNRRKRKFDDSDDESEVQYQGLAGIDSGPVASVQIADDTEPVKNINIIDVGAEEEDAGAWLDTSEIVSLYKLLLWHNLSLVSSTYLSNTNHHYNYISACEKK